MSRKDLLRCEQEIPSRLLAASRLLNPKPDFRLPQQSSILQQIKQFLPQLESANQELENETVLKEKLMPDQDALKRVKVLDVFEGSSINKQKVKKFLKRTGKKSSGQQINLDLFLGVFDIKEQVAQPPVQPGSLIQEL